ncbi:MAG: TlpA disulfide reductase family protein [Flavobacteriaceae bacterium]
MRKAIYFLLISLSISCTSEKSKSVELEQVSQDFIINGSIENYKISDSTSSLDIYINDLLSLEGSRRESITIDSLGKFSSKIRIPRQQDIWLSCKNLDFRLIVAPEDEFVINIKDIKNSLNENSIEISGTSAKLNQDFLKFQVQNEFDSDSYFDNTKKLNPVSYKTYHDSLFGERKLQIEAFIANNNIDDALKNWLFVEKEYRPADYLLVYPLNYRMFNQEKAKDLKYTDYLFDDFTNLPPIEEKYLVNTVLDGFGNYYLFHYYQQIRPEGMTMKGEVLDSIAIKRIVSENKNNKLLSQLTIFNALQTSFNNNRLSYMYSEKEIIDSLFKGSLFESAIADNFNYVKSLLENAPVPEGAELLTFDSKDPNDLLNEIIKNSEGKVIYIDNWATWCAPCRSEFKSSTPLLKEKFDKEVEFIYLCHRSNQKEWKPVISRYNVEGKHYFLTDEQTNVLMSKLSITGYPTYNMINKKGEIVYSGFEYRPSIEQTSKILEKLISE